MKRIIAMTAVCLCTYCQSQVRLGGEVGLSFTITQPLVGLSIGYSVPYVECYESKWYHGICVDAGILGNSYWYSVGKEFRLNDWDGITGFVGRMHSNVTEVKASTRSTMYGVDIWKSTNLGRLGLSVRYTGEIIPSLTYKYVF